MRPVDFNERKAIKNGEITIKSLTSSLSDAVERNDVKTVVYVTVDYSGNISLGYSDAEQTNIIGLLECGKQIVMDDME